MKRIPCFAASAAAIVPALAGGPKPLTPQLLSSGTQLQPVSAAPTSRALTGWPAVIGEPVQLGGPITRTGAFACAYDLFEGAIDTDGDGILDTHAPNVPPTDIGPAGGCAGVIAVGSRWFFGPAYINPFASNDLVPDPATAGCCAELVDFSFFWNGDGLGAGLNLAIVVDTTVLWTDCAAAVLDDGVGSELGGVAYIYDGDPTTVVLDPIPPGAGFFFSNISLVGTGLCHPIPAAPGGVHIYILTFFDADADGAPDDIDGDGIGDLLLPVGAGAGGQPMLWGAGVDEPLPDGRCGDNDDSQYDDDAPISGGHTLAPAPLGECYGYAFGLCPDPLGASIGFWCKALPCPCPGDMDGDGDVDIADLALFLAAFGSAPPPPGVPCADIDGDGDVDIADLALLLSVFGVPCP